MRITLHSMSVQTATGLRTAQWGNAPQKQALTQTLCLIPAGPVSREPRPGGYDDNVNL